MGRIVVGYDGSPPSMRALGWAARRAKPTGDEVVLVTAIPASVANSTLNQMMPAGLSLPPPLGKTFEENAQARLDEVVREHASLGVPMRALVRKGEPAEVLLDAVRELGAIEIAIGHKSYESDERKLGPIAERLVRLMPATITVVR